MTNKLNAADLWKLEDYARERPAFRQRLLPHKATRTVALGDHITVLFEDRLTVHYQIQEMLRIERIFDADGIADELAAYNPLIPDGSNLKATMLVEFPDEAQRRRELHRLREVEHRIFLQVGTQAPVTAIADEDLPRSTDEKTSAVHFLRFELDPAAIGAWRSGASIRLSVDHPNYQAAVALSDAARNALLADLD